MILDVFNFENNKTGEQSLNQNIFGLDPQKDLIFKVIHWQMAKRRSGTHQVKERWAVAGSTRKIYKQKGTGRARHGAVRAAQFRGGGIIFGPHYRPHEYKLNKKVRSLGLVHALSLKAKENEILLVNEFSINEIKTSNLITQLKIFNIEKNSSVLIVDSKVDDAVKSSCANLHNINILPTIGLNVYDIIRHKKLIITLDALDKINERLI